MYYFSIFYNPPNTKQYFFSGKLTSSFVTIKWLKFSTGNVCKVHFKTPNKIHNLLRFDFNQFLIDYWSINYDIYMRKSISNKWITSATPHMSSQLLTFSLIIWHYCGSILPIKPKLSCFTSVTDCRLVL